ncbi:MAG: sterol desaturase family protein, partial [Elusimicrobiota bacterium]
MTNFEKIRLGIFLGALIACALAERLLPRRIRTVDAGPRWLTNLGLSVLGSLAVGLLLPFAAVETAYRVEAKQFGLLNQWSIYYPLKFVLSFLLLDLLIYLQHRLFHRIPLLWRLHAVHHTDLDLDASSAVRFHPLEILVSMLIKMAAVALLGAHFLAVAVFEVILNATAIFNHANLNLGALDRLARLIIV